MFWFRNYCSRGIFLKNMLCSWHFAKKPYFWNKVNISMIIVSIPISKTSQMTVWFRRSFWCKTLGVQKVQLWLLEATKVVKKCKLRNPENNQGCQLFQTLAQFSSYRLFLTIPGKLTFPAFLGLSGYIWSLGKNKFVWNSWQNFPKFRQFF